MNGKTKYGGYKHLGWDDTTSWVTVIGLIIFFTLTGVWAFYG